MNAEERRTLEIAIQLREDPGVARVAHHADRQHDLIPDERFWYYMLP
jgi:hypothetical protein